MVKALIKVSVLKNSAIVLLLFLNCATVKAFTEKWTEVDSPYCTANASDRFCGGRNYAGATNPNIERADPAWQAFGVTVKAGGSISPNSFQLSLASNDGVNVITGQLNDTYTLTGLPGPTMITAQFFADGLYRTGPTSNPNVVVGQARVNIAILPDFQFSQIPNTQHAFDSGFIVGGVAGDFVLGTSYTLEVNPDEPFSLGFRMSLQGTHGVEIDSLNTAFIDFSIPDGASLTSTAGWVTPTAVPLPGSLVLFTLPLISILRRKWWGR